MIGANFLRHLLPTRREPVRYVVSTKAQDMLAQRKAADVRIELAVYAATTTPEQRQAEAEAFFEAQRNKRKNSIRRKAKRVV